MYYDKSYLETHNKNTMNEFLEKKIIIQKLQKECDELFKELQNECFHPFSELKRTKQGRTVGSSWDRTGIEVIDTLYECKLCGWQYLDRNELEAW
jgi:hypothetical protein